MKKAVIKLLILVFSLQLLGQNPAQINLDEVILVNNYKYLSSTDSEDLAIPVDQLEVTAANFNIKNLDVYADEYEFYDVYFIIPEGKILATYNSEGKILRTAEKFKNVNLPTPVALSVIKRFPKWDISKETYLVKYKEGEDTKKKYKLTLTNGNKSIKVKLDDQGNFL